MGDPRLQGLLYLVGMINTPEMNSLFSLREQYRGTKMQNLEPILIFITVADMGSFTLAADSLGIQKGESLHGGPEA